MVLAVGVLTSPVAERVHPANFGSVCSVTAHTKDTAALPGRTDRIPKLI